MDGIRKDWVRNIKKIFISAPEKILFHIYFSELSLPRVGEAMNYVEIGELLTTKTNWRSTANTVYNEARVIRILNMLYCLKLFRYFIQELPSYLGEFPPLKMSDESWAQLKDLGEK